MLQRVPTSCKATGSKLAALASLRWSQFEAGGRQQGGDQALNLGFPFLCLGAASIKQLDAYYPQTVTGSG